jgi:hypothetical protein
MAILARFARKFQRHFEALSPLTIVSHLPH